MLGCAYIELIKEHCKYHDLGTLKVDLVFLILNGKMFERKNCEEFSKNIIPDIILSNKMITFCIVYYGIQLT